MTNLPTSDQPSLAELPTIHFCSCPHSPRSTGVVSIYFLQICLVFFILSTYKYSPDDAIESLTTKRHSFLRWQM